MKTAKGHKPDECLQREGDAAACIVCGSCDWRPVYGALLRCECCRFVRADVELSSEELRALYGEAYFKGNEYGNYLADRIVHVRNFARRYREIDSLSGGLKSVFEIGCAYGFWLEYVTAQGVRAGGIDVCREAVAYSRDSLQQEAHEGDFLQMKLEPGDFQAYCLWDTIEHLPHPDRYVDRILELLPPGGWLFLTTGDIDAPYAKWRGRRWRMIHPPTHLHYFSASTIRRFLEARGFAEVRIRRIAMYRNLRSVLANTAALRRSLTQRVAAALHKLTPGILQLKLGAWINLGDIILVAARRF